MRIEVNGRVYGSWDDLPEDLRQQLAASGMMADEDGDGVPDVFQGTFPAQAPQASQFAVDGQMYGSIAELPPEQRAKVEAAMAAWTGMVAPQAPAIPPAPPAPAPPQAQVPAPDPADAAWAPPPGTRMASAGTADPGVVVENRRRIPAWVVWMILADLVVVAVVLWFVLA